VTQFDTTRSVTTQFNSTQLN